MRMRFEAQQLSGETDKDPHESNHQDTFSTWSFETDQPLSLSALTEMVKKRLPGNIYRCKGVVNTTEYPLQRVILQAVGRRADISLEDEWGDRPPRTQIVAIGAPGSIDDSQLTSLFSYCSPQPEAI